MVTNAHLKVLSVLNDNQFAPYTCSRWTALLDNGLGIDTEVGEQRLSSKMSDVGLPSLTLSLRFFSGCLLKG